MAPNQIGVPPILCTRASNKGNTVCGLIYLIIGRTVFVLIVAPTLIDVADIFCMGEPIRRNTIHVLWNNNPPNQRQHLFL